MPKSSLPRILFIVLVIAVLAAARSADCAGPNNGLVGVNIDGVGDGSRDRMFVDLAKTLRPWTSPTNQAVTTDADGWPTCDVQSVLFDIRPFGAWSPPIDDPMAFQPDWSGAYSCSFDGQADISVSGSGSAAIADKRYDSATNTTSFKIVVPKGLGLLVISFANTRRGPTSSSGAGFTHLRVIRPGYPADTRQIFTTSFLASLAPFSTLRMMPALNSNDNPGYYGDPGHHALEWNNRRLPTDATQVAMNGKTGLAWEYCIEMANESGKDIWINVPTSATDDYVRRLAELLRQTLKPGLRVYVEYSNEVWNFGFPQYIYNKLAAIDEVQAGRSKLADDGSRDQEAWAHRRYAERIVQISEIFRSVYGDRAMMRIVRPVYASWTISLDAHFRDPLAWVNRAYGPPSGFIYAIALGHYFNAEETAKTGSKDEILAAMKRDSDRNAVSYYKPFVDLAQSYGLKAFVYEGGSDTGGGDPANVANRIEAERDPAMKELIVHDVRDNWFGLGGSLYMYFSHAGAYSRYGCWGLTEDIVDTNTYKYQAIRELTASPAR
jgi:hypothetical protein